MNSALPISKFAFSELVKSTGTRATVMDLPALFPSLMHNTGVGQCTTSVPSG